MIKWPPRDGLPGYGMHRGRMYYTEYEDHVEHHAEPRPVGHSRYPNTKTDTRKPSRQVTLSSQETTVMTNHLAAAENTTVSARQNSLGRIDARRQKTFCLDYQVDPLATPDASGLAQTRAAADALTLAQTPVAVGPTQNKQARVR